VFWLVSRVKVKLVSCFGCCGGCVVVGGLLCYCGWWLCCGGCGSSGGVG